MTKFTKGGKITFGFKNLNGVAFDLKVISAPKGTFINNLTAINLRNFVVSEMNKAGKNAEKLAKKRSHSPYLTGALIRSIHWQNARKGKGPRVIVGSLAVDVPYGRRQEFENPTKPFYLRRAIQANFPKFISALKRRGAIENIILGKRKQIGQSGVVRGGQF